MKKKIALLVAAMTVFSLVGCTQATTPAATEEKPAEATEAAETAEPESEAETEVEATAEAESTTIETGLEKANLTLATGSSGGTYYALGGAMATEWTNSLDVITVSAISTGASAENMNLINAGEADLGISMNSVAVDCYNGTGAFEEVGAQTNFSTIGVVYPEVFQIVADASKEAKTLSDLKGMKVAVGPVGSGTACASEIVFDAAGLDISKDIDVQRDSFSDATSKMQDNLIDASCAVLSVPASAITELETTKEISFIDISDDELAKIQESFPYYSRFVIPAGTYSNTEDVNTVTCKAVLYCRPDLSEDTVYYLTKTFYEHAANIAAVHTAGEYISLDTALEGVTTPLHPGALKYYEEMNVEIPDEIKP